MRGLREDLLRCLVYEVADAGQSSPSATSHSEYIELLRAAGPHRSRAALLPLRLALERRRLARDQPPRQWGRGRPRPARPAQHGAQHGAARGFGFTSLEYFGNYPSGFPVFSPREHSGGTTIIDLDRPGRREQAADDPEYFVGGEGPVLVDEYQHVPEILDAIKARLNVSGGTGQFILTGSSRHESLPRAAQALTGRLHRIPLYPLSQGEIRGWREDLLRSLVGEFTDAVQSSPSATSRSDYIEMIVTGRLPPAVLRARDLHGERLSSVARIGLPPSPPYGLGTKPPFTCLEQAEDPRPRLGPCRKADASRPRKARAQGGSRPE